MRQNVFIVGATGKVGKELLKQILENDSTGGKHTNPTFIIGVADSRRCYISKGEDNNCEYKEFVYDDARKFLEKNGNQYFSSDFFLHKIREIGHAYDAIFVDVTAADTTAFHEQAISRGCNIVTANKIPLAESSYAQFDKITKQRDRYGYRATVMAGAHTNDFIRELYDSSENIGKIQGCFSGTLGYVCSAMEAGLPFSEAVRQASEKGYAEPNPLDDLAGRDVARKLLIIARSLAIEAEMDSMQLSPLIDVEKYRHVPPGELFAALQNEDREMRRAVETAAKEDKTLRYVGTIDCNNDQPDASGLTVALAAVPRNSPLGTLKGTANKIVIQTKLFSEKQEYIIQSPGAGADITAAGIRRDLLQMLKHRVTDSYKSRYCWPGIA